MAKEVLDWEPMVELREGLLRTIKYFDKLLAGQRMWLEITVESRN